MLPTPLAFLGTPDWRQQKLALSAARRQVIDELADAIAGKLREDKTARLIFVCTHNSRRSQFAQVWAQTAAAYFGFDRTAVQCYSGGTEVTACNPRTIASLERSGFLIARAPDDSHDAASNPEYRVSFSQSEPPVKCYSKAYDSDVNPQSEFIAVMCCDDAAENCPVVRGASSRVMMFFEDPKAADDSPAESSTYDERSRQIGQEMWSLMGSVAELTRTEK